MNKNQETTISAFVQNNRMWINVPKTVMSKAGVRSRYGFNVKKVSKNSFDIIRTPKNSSDYVAHIDGRGKVPFDICSNKILFGNNVALDFIVTKIDSDRVRLRIK